MSGGALCTTPQDGMIQTHGCESRGTQCDQVSCERRQACICKTSMKQDLKHRNSQLLVSSQSSFMSRLTSNVLLTLAFFSEKRHS